MPRLFVGNFDFEHRLAWGDGTLPRNVEAVNAELPPVWTMIAGEGDAVWTPAPIDVAVFDRLTDRGLPRLRPVVDPQSLPAGYAPAFWGQSEWASTVTRQWGMPWSGCDVVVVRRVNSRRFKFALERHLEIGLPGTAVTETVAELIAAAHPLADRSAPTDPRFATGLPGASRPRTPPAAPREGEIPPASRPYEARSGLGWVLKGEFGGAGREVRFGAGPLSTSALAWAANRFRRGLAVTVEPRLDRIDEAGLQFRIDREGTVAFDGVTPLLTRPGGGYLGSRFDEDPSSAVIWKEAIDVGWKIAEAVAAEGYFGPLGIDAMRYRGEDGAIRMRPLQDLNARYTMGRLALGLRRFPSFATAIGGVFRIDEFRAAAKPKACLRLG